MCGSRGLKLPNHVGVNVHGRRKFGFGDAFFRRVRHVNAAGTNQERLPPGVFERGNVRGVSNNRSGQTRESRKMHGRRVEDFAGFDGQRIGFIGNSLGAVVGASVLVAEPDLRFAVQNVPPGSIVETLDESPEFRPLVDALFLRIFGIEGPFDEVERHLIFDPIVDLSRWILEPVDPLALAPYLLLDPVRPNGPAEILFQVAGLDEVAAPLATSSMLAATGSTHVTRYDPAAHGMLEVLDQTSRYEPPAAPPFVLRPVELPIENPLVEEHAEIEAFIAANVAPPGTAGGLAR